MGHRDGAKRRVGVPYRGGLWGLRPMIETTAAVARIERGEVEPRPTTLRKLAKALSVQPRDSIEGYAMPSTNGHGSKPERVALYLRVSSEEQRERETIELQREFLEQYRSLMELELAEIYKDDGVSGTIPLHERPSGMQLLADARGGKFEAVLVYGLDRLGRSLLLIVDAHDRLQEAGVALRSATEPIDTSNPSGRLIFPS